MLSSGDEVIVSTQQTGGRGLKAEEPADKKAVFVGIETSCGPDSPADRVRVVAPRLGSWLSDLLLLDPAEELPGTLDATLGHVRSDNIVHAGEQIVVFWEWYGPAEPMTVTLSLSRQNKSFWRNALEWAGLADREIESTGIRWSEVGAGGEWPRAMRLDLPDLAQGEYRLTLLVQSARVGSVSSIRELIVER